MSAGTATHRGARLTRASVEFTADELRLLAEADA